MYVSGDSARAKSRSGKVSEMIKCCAWGDAISTLREMRESKETPRLGSTQRWVRECDAAGTDDPQVLLGE